MKSAVFFKSRTFSIFSVSRHEATYSHPGVNLPPQPFMKAGLQVQLQCAWTLNLHANEASNTITTSLGVTWLALRSKVLIGFSFISCFTRKPFEQGMGFHFHSNFNHGYWTYMVTLGGSQCILQVPKDFPLN